MRKYVPIMAVAAALMAGNAQADTVTLTQIGGNDNGGAVSSRHKCQWHF